MPPRPPPKTLIELIYRIVDNRARTNHAVRLMLAVALTLTLVVVPVLAIACAFGGTGVAVVSGAATTVAGVTAARLRRARKPSPTQRTTKLQK
jgi:Kef-type K+ transport system membrane component KefB